MAPRVLIGDTTFHSLAIFNFFAGDSWVRLARYELVYSLLYGIADTDLTKLQLVQNRVARIVMKSPPFTHSVPLLHSLYWLPVRFRIWFKINFLTYKTLHKNSLFTFTPCLLHHSHPAHWDRTKASLCQSVGQDQHRHNSFLLLSPISLKQPAAVCPFSHFSIYLQEASEDTSLWLSLSPIDISTPDSPLMLWSCFINFAVEHRFSCHGTEPGFAGDNAAIEIWLIDTPPCTLNFWPSQFPIWLIPHLVHLEYSIRS